MPNIFQKASLFFRRQFCARAGLDSFGAEDARPRPEEEDTETCQQPRPNYSVSQLLSSTDWTKAAIYKFDADFSKFYSSKILSALMALEKAALGIVYLQFCAF